MNPGLKQGFVRFGTAAHKILLAVHELGRATHAIILEETELEPREVGMNLTRLRECGFLVKLGRVDGYVHNCRTQAMYAIPAGKLRKLPEFQNKTAQERTRKLRATKKMKVPSVFNFRGEVRL
jgi:DNA-binding transcriptional ArsR family regulator